MKLRASLSLLPEGIEFFLAFLVLLFLSYCCLIDQGQVSRGRPRLYFWTAWIGVKP